MFYNLQIIIESFPHISTYCSFCDSEEDLDPSLFVQKKKRDCFDKEQSLKERAQYLQVRDRYNFHFISIY